MQNSAFVLHQHQEPPCSVSGLERGVLLCLWNLCVIRKGYLACFCALQGVILWSHKGLLKTTLSLKSYLRWADLIQQRTRRLVCKTQCHLMLWPHLRSWKVQLPTSPPVNLHCLAVPSHHCLWLNSQNSQRRRSRAPSLCFHWKNPMALSCGNSASPLHHSLLMFLWISSPQWLRHVDTTFIIFLQKLMVHAFFSLRIFSQDTNITLVL